jgi:hypothetical protein
MEAVQMADGSNTPSFETVWAILQENALQMRELKESQKETDRQMKETDRLLKETIAASEEERREYNKRFGNIDNRFGDVIECMITPGLLDKLNDLGLDFQEASPNHKIRDHKNKIYFEIDAFLQNSDIAMLVEIKTNLSVKYINEHIKKQKKMRAYADLHNDKRTFLGAVAGIIVPSEVKQYALENGFYMIEPSGENFNITPPNNKPKEW